MSRPIQDPQFSTRALVALCFIAVFASWALVEAVVWAATHAIEWITGSIEVEKQEQLVLVALLKIMAITCIAWTMIVGAVFWVMG